MQNQQAICITIGLQREENLLETVQQLNLINSGQFEKKMPKLYETHRNKVLEETVVSGAIKHNPKNIKKSNNKN